MTNKIKKLESSNLYREGEVGEGSSQSGDLSWWLYLLVMGKGSLRFGVLSKIVAKLNFINICRIYDAIFKWRFVSKLKKKFT